MPEITLLDLGWNRVDAAHFTFGADPTVRPARVVQQGRGAWHVHDGSSELVARARSRSLLLAPVTGDWVVISDAGGGACYVDEVLPRSTTLSRQEAGGRSAEQVIAANVDLVGICASADDVNPRRLDRELTAVWSSGAMPLVILTKTDLVASPAAVVADVEAVCVGATVVAVSCFADDGLLGVSSRLEPGTTMALIGPSGVGKSSLVNALADEAVLATTATRADGKGRHTTTSRHLVLLPRGGLLLDTPGMREFAPWVGDDGLTATFADIEELAAGCRFGDCRHEAEPDCRVVDAARRDDAVAQRLASWRTLQRELAWLERRHDARLMQQERKKWAAITKSSRARNRPR